MYIKIKNDLIEKYPYSLDEFFIENSNTSFPENIPENTLAEFGIFKVELTLKPQTDYTQNVVEEMPEYINGIWKQKWSVVDKTPEEVNKIIDFFRFDAYRNESDGLYFKAQRGEATMEDWINKVAEIKAKYPKKY